MIGGHHLPEWAIGVGPRWPVHRVSLVPYWCSPLGALATRHVTYSVGHRSRSQSEVPQNLVPRLTWSSTSKETRSVPRTSELDTYYQVSKRAQS